MRQLYRAALAAICVMAMAFPALAVENDADDAQQTQEMVVQSTKVDKEQSQVTDSVSFITEEDLDYGKYTDLTEALRATPSVQFKRNGGPGQFSYPKLRGFGAGHYLTVIDGMKVNDGYFPGVGNLFSQVEPFLVESAEVLRGPQSVLYGSDTTAGVFALTTKGGLLGVNFTAGGEYGSLNWKKGFTGLRGEQGGLHYALNMAYTDSEGVIEHDSYRNISPQAKVGWAYEDVFSVEASYFYTHSNQNFSQLHEDWAWNDGRDDWWAFQLGDPNNYNDTEYQLASVRAKHNINDQLSHKMTLGWYKKHNKALDENDGLLGYIISPEDGFTLDWTNFYNKGDSVPVYDNGTGVAAYTVNENFMAEYNFLWDAALPGQAGGNTLLVGAEYYSQEGKSWGRYGNTSGRFYTISAFANDQITLLQDKLVINGGVRYDHHQEFGSHLVGKAGAAYTFPTASTLFANAGTTFRAPSVFQLYNARYGNPNLTPEDGWTVEGGLRQRLLDNRLNFEVSYWYTELNDVIDFEYTGVGAGQYLNADKGRSQGVEFTLRWRLLKDLTLLANYTYTDSKSLDDGEWKRTVQIARHTANVGLRYTFMNRVKLMANAYYVGPRLRWRGDLDMKEYLRVDMTASVDIYKGLSVYGRVQNLFGTEIEEGLGFKEPGFYGVVGVRWDFDFASLIGS